MTPNPAVDGRTYGYAMLGAEVGWERDRWGGRFAFTPVASLAAGLRNTSGPSSYLTGTLGLGIRWYLLGPLALSVTAVRLEGGPKVRGKGEVDHAAGVHGPPGGEYYLLAESRIGPRAPARHRRPPGRESDNRVDVGALRNGEILGFRIGIEL